MMALLFYLAAGRYLLLLASACWSAGARFQMPATHQFPLFRISNIEHGISNDEVFLSFDILRFSVF
jgi:hypothetical protein